MLSSQDWTAAPWWWAPTNVARAVLEAYSVSGVIGLARREGNRRVYDLIERIVPPHIHNQPTPTRADAQRELTRIAARAYGVATEPDLGDYFRLPRERTVILGSQIEF